MIKNVRFVIQGKFDTRGREFKNPELEIHPGDVITWNEARQTYEIGGPRRPLLKGPIVMIWQAVDDDGHRIGGEVHPLVGPMNFREAAMTTFAIVASKNNKYLVRETVEDNGRFATWEILRTRKTRS